MDSMIDLIVEKGHIHESFSRYDVCSDPKKSYLYPSDLESIEDSD
ncbi:unnamed protein product, partial [Brachionus calyciflorus]